MEGQGAIAFPKENHSFKVYSSTQGPSAVQSIIARVLNIGMHQVEVEVGRLGGGFGGKEDQATHWAALACLGSYLSGRPVKLVLDRSDDMKMTGKRHPYEYDYKMALDHSGKILAYDITFYQNGGAAADLSPAVLSRSIFHACNTYQIKNLKITAYSCKTNLVPNTAFRGFGAPQAVFAMECVIRHAAETLGVPAYEIQRKNLIKNGETFHYGQKVEHCKLKQAWDQLEKDFSVEAIHQRVDAFNASNHLLKKGLAYVPICFGISFTKSSMNQASALVHIYFDGSIGVHTAAVEMGQGVNTKILNVVQDVFGVSRERVKIFASNTKSIANTSPTAASTGADLNGKAAQLACKKLKSSLLKLFMSLNSIPQASKKDVAFKNERIELESLGISIGWAELVHIAFEQRLSLSAHEHYKTPHLHFNPETFLGHPYAYHVYGVSLTEVRVDTVRGIFDIDGVYIIHDFGDSLNTLVDGGQLEGALMQGIGWLTMEDVVFNSEGKPLTDTLSAYKIPDLQAAPKKLVYKHLEHAYNPRGFKGSKGVGEPPLLYGIGTYLAIREAIKSFRPNISPTFDAPMTPEKILLNLYRKDSPSITPP